MPVMDDLDLILHKIRVKLYPSHLQNAEGQFIARTDNERTLTPKDICIAAKTRGGFPGSIDEMLETVKWYNAEAVYQLCDGYAVSNDYYTLYPHISGTFDSPNSPFDPHKNRFGIRMGARKRLNDITRKTSVEIEGLAGTGGDVYYLTDQEETDFAHNAYLPGDMVAIHGNKIKIAGDSPGIGVFFIPADDPSKEVKMTRMGDNNASRITGIAPDTQHTRNRIEIRTQYNGSASSFLKEIRVIRSGFVLEAM